MSPAMPENRMVIGDYYPDPRPEPDPDAWEQGYQDARARAATIALDIAPGETEGEREDRAAHEQDRFNLIH